MQERAFIEWIQGQSAFDPAVVPVGPGDDCAVVNVGGRPVLVTIDQVLDGVHFRLAEHGPKAAGRKAMARNLSDIAAMAGEPTGAVASVALPRGMDRARCEAIYEGLREIGDAFGCPVAGGDVGAWDGPLAVSVTVLGRPHAKGPVLRSGAAAGDAVCVTGSLGGAWAGDRHLTFTPRIGEARALIEQCDLHAMIDISDGLAADLHHLCEASGVGAKVSAAEVPVAPGADLAAALGDGEDYELLFALPAEQADALIQSTAIAAGVRRIGRFVAGSDIVLIGADGKQQPLKPDGWEHAT